LDAEHWSINLEWNKGDTWLVNNQDSQNVGIEFKCVHNNKNCRGKIYELRRDLSDEKLLPEGFSGANTIRFGLAVLVHLRYQRGSEGCYQTLGGVVRDPWSAERFVNFFRAESASPDSWFGTHPRLCLRSDIVQVVSLDGGIGIDPAFPGSGVWLALTAAEGTPGAAGV
jgi:hypothetical protein